MTQETKGAAAGQREKEPPRENGTGPRNCDRFLTSQQVCDRMTFSRSTLNRRVRTDPDFPQPRDCGGMTRRWSEAELHAYMLGRPRVTYDDHAFDPNDRAAKDGERGRG